VRRESGAARGGDPGAGWRGIRRARRRPDAHPRRARRATARARAVVGAGDRRPPAGNVPAPRGRAAVRAGPPARARLLRRWSWLLDELRRTHRDVVELIGTVKPDFVTEARVPIVMVVNVSEDDIPPRALHWVEDLDWKAYALVSWRLHAIDHMKQARKVLTALA